MNFIRKIVYRYSEEDVQFYDELKKLLNFSPRHLNKYKKAFTHSSVHILDRKGIPINYERLEFLGDSILGSIIATYLYNEVPKASEGYLTQMRSKIVSREHLNTLGKGLDLIRFIKSNVNQANVGTNIHGNIFEALIGAIYLDRGYDVCQKFIHEKVLTPYVDIKRLEGKITSYKGLIIEWCQKKKKKYIFESYEDSGNESVKHFSVRVSIDGEQIAKGRAKSKKKAEEQAAKRVYFVFQNEINRD